MKSKFLVAAVLVGALIGAWKISKEREAQPDLANTEQFISYASDQAVADAQKFDGITLDYSIDSIKNVDAVLGQVHDSYVKNPDSVQVEGVAAEYGAYVGEVIRRHEPGTYWTKDSKTMGQKIYPLHRGSSETYPIAWCAHKVINGDEDNIWTKYTVLRDDVLKAYGKKDVSKADSHSEQSSK
jgi:hypothetical protein